MRKTSTLSAGNTSICIVASIVVGAALFAIGFYLGQISGSQQARAALASSAPSSPFSHPSAPGTLPPGLPPGAPPSAPRLPPNATPEMKEFMENRAQLTQKLEEYRAKNHLTDPNQPPTQAQIAEFQKENADLLARQQKLNQLVSDQLSKNPLPEPPPLQFPPNATPELKAYLTTRDKLMRSQVLVINKNRTSDQATRQAAMQAWQKENAGLIQQLKDEEAVMAKTNKPSAPPAPMTPPPSSPAPSK